MTTTTTATTCYAGTFPGRADQLSQVRREIAAYLAGCPAADDIILIADELAANAILHTQSRGSTFTVRCHASPGQARIEVEDLGGPWRQQRNPGDRPHGLDIVKALTGPDEWGNPADRHRRTHRLGQAHMVSIGAGPTDPRAWVRAAYTLIEAAEAAAPATSSPPRPSSPPNSASPQPPPAANSPASASSATSPATATTPEPGHDRHPRPRPMAPPAARTAILDPHRDGPAAHQSRAGPRRHRHARHRRRRREHLPMGTRQSPAFRPVPPLFAAFDIEVLWNKADRQATVHAEITENTLRAVTAILNPDQDGYDDTNPAASTDDPAPIGHLISTLEGTRAVTVARDPQLA